MKKSQHGLACINNNFYKRVFKIFLIKGNQHTLYQLSLGHELKREETFEHTMPQGHARTQPIICSPERQSEGSILESHLF